MKAVEVLWARKSGSKVFENALQVLQALQALQVGAENLSLM